MTNGFDVFLSHNSKDKPAVRELAEALRARGLRVWLDEWELVPGRPWQEALEEVIETTGSSAVLVGKDGLGPWQDKEIRGCLSEFVARNLPVIPVLLSGAPEVPRLPIFLKGFTWVDLRGGLTEEGIDRLQWGATGKRPNRSKPPSIHTAAPEAAVAAAMAQPASAKVRSTPFGVEAPAALARERSNQSARALWGVPAWIGLLMLLGIAVFLLDYYFPRSDEPTRRPPASALAVQVGENCARTQAECYEEFKALAALYYQKPLDELLAEKLCTIRRGFRNGQPFDAFECEHRPDLQA